MPQAASHVCSPSGPEQPVGPVMNLQATELPGQRVRVSWSPVPGATEYRVTVRSIQGEADTASSPLQHTLKFRPSGSDGICTPPPSTPRSPQRLPVSLSIHLLSTESRPVTGSAAPALPHPALSPLPAPRPCPWLSPFFDSKLNPCPLSTPISHPMSPSSSDPVAPHHYQ